MPKYLIQANYLTDGVKGLLKEGGTGRRDAVDELFKSMGGTVEAFYFAFGNEDVFIIADLPDNATAAALAIRVNAAGVTQCKTTVLLTPQEIDEAVTKTGTYRPPGYEIDQAEVAKWDSEGGHLARDSTGKRNQ
ncbi:GYD domain-containing protein [Noviherbaspirillum autotrophicum]|uniref:GYD domain protein n=1 Tax=Noviherbaspirillum autotrophicum TaxID=709839 RepID=A0A0C1YN82_9BURK|nr:GYD domain-containing protein [Noviherbaspirillum autotrophicum]KIF81646.1 GYD domain protein [Noviherbaspirillum autotrophicum]KIF82007.1 GYD domain protein [Noviherbaspirillum autotrophicum]KIF84107.1 GYD domain protein [Noviherbaspirillum autotrophicum]